MEQRHQRMLEEVLRLPGNDTCADCHAPAPRWASTNLGIFLCVGCASVHRKMGTHKSRVKSVTLDTWSRDQITSIRSMGNIASNQIFNPNEKLHPPPPSYGHEERDSEIEKYIRKKYEQGAFKLTAPTMREPTSLNRARERDGRLPAGPVGRGNLRNPELNDVVVLGQRGQGRDRDLPPLPPIINGASPSALPRARPTRSTSGNNLSTNGPIWNAPSASASSSTSFAKYTNGSTSTNGVNVNSQQNQYNTQPKTKVANLIDFSNTGGGTNSTLPLQVDMSSSPQNGWNGPNVAAYKAGGGAGYLSASYSSSDGNGFLSASPSPSIGIGGFSPSPSTPTNGNGNRFATSPIPQQNGMFGTSPQQMGMQQYQNPFGHLSPQPTFQPTSSPSFVPQNQFGTSPSFVPQQQQFMPQQGGYGGGQSYGMQLHSQGMTGTTSPGMYQAQGPYMNGQAQQGGWGYGYVSGQQRM
ncbi:hypothetical protein IAR55_004274 [Kwoniella newhampshirensis]|uniref:Arf-GAP domain-containing protein n=1 Tax=Kwoniella newhampshirensis TaxID=1651941 RepID=A0AAW0YJT4_9TREE